MHLPTQSTWHPDLAAQGTVLSGCFLWCSWGWLGAVARYHYQNEERGWDCILLAHKKYPNSEFDMWVLLSAFQFGTPMWKSPKATVHLGQFEFSSRSQGMLGLSVNLEMPLFPLLMLCREFETQRAWTTCFLAMAECVGLLFLSLSQLPWRCIFWTCGEIRVLCYSGNMHKVDTGHLHLVGLFSHSVNWIQIILGLGV